MTFCSTTLGSDSGAFLSSFFTKKIFFILSTMEVDFFSLEGLSCSVTGGTIPGVGLEGTGVNDVAGIIAGGTFLGVNTGGVVITVGIIAGTGLEGTGVNDVAVTIGGGTFLGVNTGGVLSTGGFIAGTGLEGTGVNDVAGIIVGGTFLGVNTGGVPSTGGIIDGTGLEVTGVNGVAVIIGGGVILGGTIPADGLEGTGVNEVAGILGGVVILGVNIGGVLSIGGLVSLGLTIPDSDLPGICLNGVVTFTIFCCLSNQSKILRGPTKITDKGPFNKKDEGDPVDISEAFTGSDFLPIKKFFTRSIIETGFLSSLSVF